ncbi:MAG: Rieske 2Fe-2S domain-containing protein [Thermoproteota archaeon]|nr:Rieske 2Fe-2S domain-containing protein [Thermoproteota archaeon]
MAEDEQYQKIANRKDLKEGGLLKIEPNGKSIVLAMVNGHTYAMDSICSHEGGPLEEGTHMFENVVRMYESIYLSTVVQ